MLKNSLNDVSASEVILMDKGTKQFSIIERTEHRSKRIDDDIAEERAVAMIYNGISHAVMMATPLNLMDFAVGFSLSEGIIDHPSQIKDIEIIESDLGYELQLEINNSPFMALKQRRRQLSGRSGCGLCGLESLAAVKPTIKKVKASSLPSFSLIAKAKETLNQQQFLRAKCGAVHGAAFVSYDNHTILVREDVGRHNALDKLLGAAAYKEECTNDSGFIFVSSRASYEMVFKTASQGFSTLVSESAPTSMAIELAKEANLNLIGFVRLGRQVIYNEAF